MRPSLFIIVLFFLGTALLRSEEAKGPFKKVLFVGDSITLHGPNADLGWSGKWGMAASAEANDYAHLFLAKLTQSQGGVAPEAWISGEGGGKITDKIPLLPRFTDFHADLAIVQLGENDNAAVTEDGFQKPYEQLLQAIRDGNPSAKILCAGVWSPPSGNSIKDAMIRAACKKYGAVFVDLQAANADPANKAAADKLFTHPGVLWHPGDRGMVAYADALWQALTATETEAAATLDSAPVSKPVVVEETWSSPLSLPWQPAPPLADEGGKGVAKIVSDGTASASYVVPLNAADFHGREVIVHTRIRGEGISDKPNRWNGVNLKFSIKNAEGKVDYPQFALPVGTFDWTEVNWRVRIPDNAVALSLMIGLEKVSGTVWYDAIRVSTVD